MVSQPQSSISTFYVGSSAYSLHRISGLFFGGRFLPESSTYLTKLLPHSPLILTSTLVAGRGTVHPNPESGLLRLRQHLGAFANIRPCTFYSRSLLHLSPLKPEIVSGTDFVILRENCGGAYYGPKTERADYACDTWGYSRVEIERCARVAGALAMQGKDLPGGDGRPLTVTSSDKANVLASGRLWRKVVSEVFAAEFPDVELRHQLADSLAMIMIKNPRQFNGVVVTDNTFGDMLSDEAGGLMGTLGLLPSASLCGSPPSPGKAEGVNGIYEPVHGSAPDIAGKGLVNPIGQILSVALMLRYSFGMLEVAQGIEHAVGKVLDARDIGGMELRTGDLGGSARTSEIGDAVCGLLKESLGSSGGAGGGEGGLAPPVLQNKRLSAMMEGTTRPVTAHRDENLKWEKKLEGLPRHEPLAL